MSRRELLRPYGLGGCYMDGDRGGWRATIVIKGKRIYRRYKDPVDAEKWLDVMAAEKWGVSIDKIKKILSDFESTKENEK